MKIILIVGARPNFMKAYPVYEALKESFDLTLIHTGQHFDAKMSDVFFNQLKFPKPDIHLSLEKKTKAGDFDDKLYIKNKEYLENKDKVINDLISYQGELGQLGEIRDKLKIEFEKINPDLVIVFGDVTSTLGASLSAKILNIDLAHIESGLRSGDMLMPEEVNRVLTDHITKYYFVTEQSGIDNLKQIRITENVYLVGNTMIDTQKKYLQQALEKKYHEKLGLKSKEYILITLHRPSNVDDMDKLKEIFDDFEKLSQTETLVYPIHPRTKNNLEQLGFLQKVQENPNIILNEPLGYLEFTCLMTNCKYLITDSGGLQEESTSLNIPCFTLRENTERPSTFIENHGTNQLIHKISEIELKECKGSMDLWDGKSSTRIYEKIYNNYDESLLVNKNKILKNFYKEQFKKLKLDKIDYYERVRFSVIISETHNDTWDTLLNIGTGHGEIEKLLNLNFNLDEKNVTSMDISWYNNLIFCDKIKYIQTNINDINNYFPEKSIDVILISEVMEHLNKDLFHKSLEKLKKIVKKKLVVTVPFNEKFPLFQQTYLMGHKQSFNLYKIKNIFHDFDLKFISRYNQYWAHLVFKPLNLLISNLYPGHLEVIESIIVKFLPNICDIKYCNIDIELIDYLNIEDKSKNPQQFINYIKNKYKNVNFQKRNIEYDYIIDNTAIGSKSPTTILKANFITSNEDFLKNNYPKNKNIIIYDSKKHFYISHRIEEDFFKDITNVYYLTPLCKTDNYFIPSILPSLSKKVSEKLICAVQGNLWVKSRNFESLIPLLETYDNFYIKLIGRGNIPDCLKKYIKRIIMCNNLEWNDYHKAFDDVYCIFPLIDDSFKHNYFSTTLTSSISYALAYNLKCFYHRRLHEIYKLENSFVYDTNNIIPQFKKVINSFLKYNHLD